MSTIYIKLTGFEDYDSGKLPFKYCLLRCCCFREMSKTKEDLLFQHNWFIRFYMLELRQKLFVLLISQKLQHLSKEYFKGSFLLSISSNCVSLM